MKSIPNNNPNLYIVHVDGGITYEPILFWKEIEDENGDIGYMPVTRFGEHYGYWDGEKGELLYDKNMNLYTDIEYGEKVELP